MSFFVQTTPAPVLKTKNVHQISMILAGFIILMVVAQLFSFEKFPEVLANISIIDDSFASVWAAIIVVLEVAALPFLLRMVLSPLARTCSMVAGWLVTAVWVVLTIAAASLSVSPLLGATVPLVGGWWSMYFCIGIGVLSVWASWGMWPMKSQDKK
jgi:hypothetical protein